MNLKKLAIGSVAVMTVGVFAAACSSSGGGSKTYTLSNGSYAFDASPAPTITPDTCYTPGGSTETELGALLGASLTVTNATGTSFTVVPPSAASGFIPPITGTKDGNNLSATGGAALAIQSNCTLTISGDILGQMTANDQFNAAITLGVTASRTTAANLSQSCANLVGSTIGGVLPFPTLTNATDGNCSLTVSGHASKI